MHEKIPQLFLSAHAKLSWREVLFGLNHKLISAEVAVDKALFELGENCVPSATIVELATERKSEAVVDLVGRLAAAEPDVPIEVMQQKWLYLQLAWLYESRAGIEDPLGAVESVYAEFGYPAELAPFIRYMPMQGADLLDRAKNEERLFERWRDYVAEAEKRLSGQ